MVDNNYAQDLSLLKQYTDVVELVGDHDDRVAVTPAWQGRAMTSTLAGDEGVSYGWLNEPFIRAGHENDPHFNNYGGEDRFWLGPEAGQFGLWFKPGDPFDQDHWFTPTGFGAGAFHVTSQGDRSIAMAAQFEVTNTAGTTFPCAVQRTIDLLTFDEMLEYLGATPGRDVKCVSFESINTLANAGDCPWTPDNGLPSIWILGMMKGLPNGWVIVPFHAGDEATMGPAATTDYFGAIPPERCKVQDDFVAFKVDAKYRSKIGISPARSKDAFGSYDPDTDTLTIVQFTLPAGAAKLPYVNSLWEIQDKPFAGDAINSYNDGGVQTPEGLKKTFYELESSSPAAELDGGESLTHYHITYHFQGAREDLADLAMTVLGVDLNQVC